MSNIIRFDKEGIIQAERFARREREAQGKLRKLMTTKASGAAPLTDEDFFIVQGVFRRNGAKHAHAYFGTAYLDYSVFFLNEVARVSDDIMRELGNDPDQN